MHMSCFQRLCFATFLLTCYCQITFSQTLPSTLQTAIPICAQPCVEEAIEQDFVPSICPNSTDFDCLCSHYGSDGYTLGERAFGCLYSGNCTSASQADAIAGYTICAEQNDAVTPTHSTVIITAMQTTSTGGTTIPMGDQTVTAMPTTSDTAMGSSTLGPSTTQAAMNTSPTTSASRSSGSIQLTEAQVAGIAIASIALVVLTVGIAGCLLFIRRRNKNLEMEDSKLLFHHSRNASGSQTSHLGMAWKDPRGGPGGVGIVPLRPEKRQIPAQPERTWPRYYPIMPTEDIGIAQTTNVPLQMPPSPTAPAMPVVNQIPMPVIVPHHLAPSTPRNATTKPERPRTGYGTPQPVFDHIPAMASASTASSSPRNVNSMPDRPRSGDGNSQSVFDYAPMANSSLRNINPVTENPIMNQGTSQPPSAPPVAETTTSPTKRARRSIDPTAILSQVTEFEEEGYIPRPISHSRKQQQQQYPPPPPPPPTQPVGQDQNRGRTPTRPAVPALRATSGSPRLHALRPSSLKIQIPSYPATAVGPAETTFVTSYQPPQTQPQQYVFPVPPSNATVRSQQPLRIITNQERLPQLYNQRPSPNATNHSRFANQAPQRSTSALTAALAGRVPTAANLAKNRAAKASNKASRRSQRSHAVATRESMASFTSFETVDSEDDPTSLKEEDKQLKTQDKESSPISNLRYPKIPRSSNQVVSQIPPSPKNSDSPNKVSPLRVSPSTPSPRNGIKASSPRGVADQLWRTETRQLGSSTRPSPIANPGHEPQFKFQRGDPRQQLSRNVGTSQQLGGSSPQMPTNGQSSRWEWAPDIDVAIAQFNLKSPFGTMPKLTPTKQGEDLYLSVSRD